MNVKRFPPSRDEFELDEAAAPELVRDLRALGHATAVDRPFIDQLGRRLQAEATLPARPAAAGRLWALASRSPRWAIAAALALALIAAVGATGAEVAAAGPEGLTAKLQQIAQSLAFKLGVPAESIRLERQADGDLIVVMPDGTKGSIDQLFPKEGKAGKVPPGSVAVGKVALDVTSVAARALAVSPEQLRQEMNGRSLAEIAEARGVGAGVVAGAIRAELRAQAKEMPPTKVEMIVGDIMGARSLGEKR